MKPTGLNLRPHEARSFRHLVGVALAFACLIVASPAAHATSSPIASTEDPAVQAMAAQAYADEFNVSLPTAFTRVALQDATAPLLDDIRAAIGSSFGGSWYDASDGGKLKIGVAGSQDTANVQAASAVVSRAGLQDDVSFVPVQYSLSDLLAAQRAVDSQLAAQIANDQAQTSIDVTANAVAVTVSELAPAAAVKAAASATSLPVSVNHLAQPTLGWRPSSCAFLSGSFSSSQLFCDPPLRGGPMISANGVGCTAGFIVWGNSGGSPWLMTAGHCLAADGGQKWQTRFSDGTLHDIGYRHSYNYSSSGDYGLIGIQNPSGWGIGSPGYVWVAGVPGQTTQNSFYAITTNAYASAGQVVCDSSGPLLQNGYHSSCGTVQSGLYTDAAGVSGLYEVTACGVEGSSGGPVYKNNAAYGLVIATAGSCAVLYQPAPNAFSASGVHV